MASVTICDNTGAAVASVIFTILIIGASSLLYYYKRIYNVVLKVLVFYRETYTIIKA